MQHDGFELFQHSAGHRAMPDAIDVEIVRRRGNIQLVEENIRHIRIEMLPGVNQDLADMLRCESVADRCGLDELWPRADDSQYLRHGFSRDTVPANRPAGGLSA